ncbi:MAG: SprT-like domain-containing protein [Gammaproteobacteria bacterium]|jgi:SprT protein
MPAELDERQKRLVARQVRQCIKRASDALGCRLTLPDIHFDLQGRAAGQFCLRQNTLQLRFNSALFSRYFDENLAQTVPHEVAHYLVYVLFMKTRKKRVRPHGPEWQSMMRLLGATPETRHSFSLDGIPVRREQRFAWNCDCRTHSIAKRTHLRMLRGEQRVCITCGSLLQFPADTSDS